MTVKEQLINDIIEFIHIYASISPNWDGESEDEKYTGPDPYQLLMVKDCLLNDIKPQYPWSEWGSGCYKPYSSKEGRTKHDELLTRIKEFSK